SLHAAWTVGAPARAAGRRPGRTRSAEYRGTTMRGVTTTVLTGDDLRLEDVWAVAVERAPAAGLGAQARRRMTAAREVVERAAHGSREHTYGVNTGFGRFVSRS